MRALLVTAVTVLVGGLAVAAPAGATTATGSISGLITSASTGAPLAGAEIYLFSPASGAAELGFPDAQGRFTYTGLAPASDYTVCVDTEYTALDSGVGYPSRCLGQVPWDGSRYDRPDGSTSVPVRAGTTSTANLALPLAGGISGRVTAAADGTGLGSVQVEVVDAAGTAPTPFPVSTTSTGNYRVTRLEPGHAYLVCFQSYLVQGGAAPYGYAPQCYRNTDWDGASPPPAATTPVAVSSGALHVGVSPPLRDAGALSGTVSTAASGVPVPNTFVSVIADSGAVIGVVDTDSTGRYTIRSLAPSPNGYRVCFAHAAPADGYAYGFAPQCWRNRPGWTQTPPAASARIAVGRDVNAQGVDTRLAPGGAIHVHLVTQATGGRVYGALVRVFDSAGVERRNDFVDYNGVFSGLLPDPAGYTVCVDTGFNAVPSGLRSTCWTDVPWAGGAAPPAPGATAVPVVARQQKNITIVLPPA